MPALVVGDGSFVVGGVVGLLLVVELAGGGGCVVSEVGAGGCDVGVVGSEVCDGSDVGVESLVDDGGGVVSAEVGSALDGGGSEVDAGSEVGSGVVVDSAGAEVGVLAALSDVGVVSAAAVVVPLSAASPVTEVASVVGDVSEEAAGVLGVVGSVVGDVSEVAGVAGVAGGELDGAAVSDGAVVSAVMSVLVELDAIVNCLATFTGPGCLRAGTMLASRNGEKGPGWSGSEGTGSRSERRRRGN